MLRATMTLALAAAAAATSAQVPTYTTFDLQVRSNIVDGFNLPANSSFNSGTPAIDGDGRVGMRLLAISGDGTRQGIWLGPGDGTGAVAWDFTDTDAVIGDLALDGAGGAVFPINWAASTTNGVWAWTPGGGGTLLTTLPIGASYWSSVGVNSAGQVGYYVSFASGHAWVSVDGGAVHYHAVNQSALPTSPWFYLFTPAFNDTRQIAGKVSVANHDQQQVRIFESDGSSSLIAENDDLSPASPYVSFRNSVALTDDGRVAFVAGLVGGGTGVFLSDGATTVEIATTADPEVSEVEYFAPAVNAAGQVAFRGVDGAGLQAIFVGNGTSLVRVIGAHDLLPTDLGTARIDQNNASDPVFGGAPALAPNGDLAFVAALTPPDNDQVEWGSGLFVARAGTVFTDGFESGATTHWTTTVGG